MTEIEQEQEQREFELGYVLVDDIEKAMGSASLFTQGVALAAMTARWINAHGRALTPEIETGRDRLIEMFVSAVRANLDVMDTNDLELPTN